MRETITYRTRKRVGGPWLLLALTLLLPQRAFATDDTTVTPPPPIVLNEIMVNPQSTTDDVGEWIELWNVGDRPARLDGLSLEIADTYATLGEVRFETSAGLTAGAFLVIGPEGLVYPLTGQVPPEAGDVDWRYGGALSLPNDGGSLRLLWNGVVIDEVRLGGDDLPIPIGASLNREPSVRSTPRDGQDPVGSGHAVWCASVVEIRPGGDRGTPGAPNTWCDDDGDGHAEDSAAPDCDDSDNAVYPAAPEACNGVDDDCDGVTDNPASLFTTLACLQQGVCAGAVPTCVGEDGWLCPYPEEFEAEETRCDALDNDCDGATDEGLRNACGRCGPLGVDLCNGADDDCDGETDEDSLTEPLGNQLCLTEGVCAGAAHSCAGGDGWRCDYPETWELDETRCDTLDNDCDGETDEGFELGEPCTTGLGACEVLGTVACAEDGSSAVCDATSLPADGLERCGDGVDNDCDGAIDEGFEKDGDDCTAGEGACRTLGKWLCSADELTVVCSAVPSAPESEICGDRVDNDCDGATDEGDCRAEIRTADPAAACGAHIAPPTAPSFSLWLPLMLLAVALALRSRRRCPRPV